MKFRYLNILWLWILLGHASPSIITNGAGASTFNSISPSDLNEVRRDLDHKITAVNNLVILVDANIKALQEKAHVWDLYRHHIDAWNDQMKSLDHKIDLIRHQQDESKIIETKLTSMEFLMNHILSKIMLQIGGIDSIGGSNNTTTVKAGNNLDTKHYEDLMKMLKDNKITQREISNRLNNILRHVLSIENSNCRSSTTTNKFGSKNSRSANLMKPVGRDTDSILRNIETKLEELSGTFKPKELKQFISSERKNTKSIEEILQLSQNVAEISRRLENSEAEHSNKFMNCCSSTMNELSTFTESSDLLLKRIERLVLNIQEKVDKVATSNTVSEEETISAELTTTELVSLLVEENTAFEEIMTTSTSNNPAFDVETLEEFESTESIEPDYVQPSKFGCHDLTLRIDGVYKFSRTTDMNDAGRDFNERYCAFPTDGVGWTIIQRREPYDHQENFNRSWIEYKSGFGSLAKDFWFGNEFIHRLTYNGTYELRIELEDFDDVKVWAEYSIFQVDSEKYNYNLIIGGYRGAITDSMLYHHMQDFSTYDKRNDKSIDECCPCATGYGSGWWYDNCSEANLNGIYHNTPLGHNYIGIVWEHWHGDYSLKKTRMLIRPTIIISADSDENAGKEMPDDP